jgi:hypothetical protein
MLSAATKERPVRGDVTAEIVCLAAEGLGDDSLKQADTEGGRVAVRYRGPSRRGPYRRIRRSHRRFKFSKSWWCNEEARPLPPVGCLNGRRPRADAAADQWGVPGALNSKRPARDRIHRF